jgi:DNA gyrase subunit A
MIINRSGLTIRMAVSGIKIAGRATQGVKLINIKEGDSIAAVSVVNKSEEETPQEVAQDAPQDTPQENPTQETNN